MVNTFNRNDGTFAQVDFASVTGTSAVSLTSVTNFTTADISISSSTSNFTTGPFVTQGSSGTWFVSGAVTFTNTVSGAQCFAKLWDGTSIIASGASRVSAVNTPAQIALCGVITNPSSNIKIASSANVPNTVMAFNDTGSSMDCNLTAIRIA